MQLALGTLASGVGSANMNRLLSFLNLQNTRFLNKRFIRNMKSSIGSKLRKVATDSMEEAIEEKFRFRLEKIQRIQIEYQKQKRNSYIGITVSFDMGWSKRSSGNRYDSLS